jgi:hypothetical protein
MYAGIKFSVRVDAVLGVLHREIGRLSWTRYESGNVAMLLLSRTPERTDHVADRARPPFP